ncbi:MAG TPA: hemolysin family protein [Candidatus Treponema faecavium]|nr:hemolysin family protein [Candidatus Treponema faecavium]
MSIVSMGIMAIGIVLLIFASAFFSSSETAYLSLDRLRLRQLVKSKLPAARRVQQLKSNMDKLLTTILIGNNFVNNFASSLATAIAVALVGEGGAGVATAVMTVLIISFGEVLPKTIAIYRIESIACAASPILRALELVLTPVVKVFTLLTSGVGFVIDKIWKSETPLITEEELKTLIEVGSQEGTLEAGESDMLYKIFEFSDLRVRDIVRHRSLVSAVSVQAGYEETVRAFHESGYSRLPVFDGEPNNYVGFVHYKDALFYRSRHPNEPLEQGFVRRCMRSVLFVPETQTALSLLHTFHKEKANFAVVVDEHGSNSGIVAMDDLLNAVFGRITDEYTRSASAPEERIQILSATEFRIPGDLRLSDVNGIFHLDCESTDFDTIGGWLLEQFGYLPSTGEVLRKGKTVFIVEDQAQRRIKTIRLSLRADGMPAGESKLGIKAAF